MNSSRHDEDHIYTSSPSPTGSSEISIDALVPDGRSKMVEDVSEGNGSSPADIPGSQARRFVQFDVADQSATANDTGPTNANGFVGTDDAQWTPDDDFLNSSDDEDFAQAVERGTAPLLTSIAAPSVVVAGMDLGNLESSSARSGMKMAFMNMANSIM
ncbi:hypothetical protein Dda_8033 [Drechslerella dactyloides]|uniref:Uncharacterized protein n=1 Tax=Drechslerella dactyloides TaxID=74499 RepID=A0AAD6IRM6_DREDA|nr:hypothetical protein Dda_8033 [Drechslerella dactyloides]